jgi:biotin-dependent carboxylase-like uncharacterized protein
MSARVSIVRCGPLTTIQDRGRLGALKHGVSASGAMDASAFEAAGFLAGSVGEAGIEFTSAGIALEVMEGETSVGWAGGQFGVRLDGVPQVWPGQAVLRAGSLLEIATGPWGNFGYLRFGGEIDVPLVMGSRATSTRARLGGFEGRALSTGDALSIVGAATSPGTVPDVELDTSPLRFVWGIHAQNFTSIVRQRFENASFSVTSSMDRMGFRLGDSDGVFVGTSILSLVSEPVLPGDVQILGDGTPIVLMRDHQPTGGYPRIATVIRTDLDRLAQMRPGTKIAFRSVTVEHAQALWRSRRHDKH